MDNLKTNHGSTEIDIQLADESTVEVKSRHLTGEADIEQLRRQQAYRSENGLSGNHYVAVKGYIDGDVRTFMDDNNIRLLEKSRYTS